MPCRAPVFVNLASRDASATGTRIIAQLIEERNEVANARF